MLLVIIFACLSTGPEMKNDTGVSTSGGMVDTPL